ncbi:MAG: gluconolactonase, partial [Acidimicrobiaceae bacterium]
GLALDPQGRLLAAETQTRRITRTEADGKVNSIVDQFKGKRFNEPNDIAVRSDGTIYFTDPLFGQGSTELDFHGVFRIAPDGNLTAERRGAISESPNGVALSPDEKRLYMADTQAQRMLVFDVAADGSLSEARRFASTQGYPDGMAVDAAGNVFVASVRVGIEVFAPDGTARGTIPLPNPGLGERQPTNCAFGGADARTLYITAKGVLYRVKLQQPGLY